MDYKLLAFSAIAVFGVLFVSGLIVSLLSTQLQCSKTGVTTSAKQGAISAVAPTLVYTLAAVFFMVRHPFSGTFESFGVPEDTARILGVGYVTMLTAWITTVWNVHNSEKTVCQTNLKEMTDFKKKMMAELAQKEKEKEQQAKKD
jgi:Na+(H+)/acetate symporter ActP